MHRSRSAVLSERPGLPELLEAALREVPGEPGGEANGGQSLGTRQEAHLQMVEVLRNKVSTWL